MKVWEGETAESMKKGLGHYSSTSAWNGNVSMCGHNRGAKYVIGSIKDLKQGDIITYTTVYGTRTYQVTTVQIIANTDWSYLQATTDNRITITTCLADHPKSRVCVQATSGGHFIVLRGVQDGQILVADPASYRRSEKLWDLSIILNEASKRAGAGGPFWLVG